MDKEAEATGIQIDENNMKDTKRLSYPTKNILPFFKPSFISYLAKHFEER
jgi:hypothetical protein